MNTSTAKITGCFQKNLKLHWPPRCYPKLFEKTVKVVTHLRLVWTHWKGRWFSGVEIHIKGVPSVPFLGGKIICLSLNIWNPV